MAIRKSRPVCDTIWSDKKFKSMERWERYLFLYLLTNEHLEQVGIYTLPYETIAFDTDLTVENVQKGMQTLKANDMVDYDNETGEVAILNYLKYSVLTGGSPTKKCFENLGKKVDSLRLLEEVYDKAKHIIDEREIYTYYMDKIRDTIDKKLAIENENPFDH